MGQVTVYLDEKTEALMEKSARAAHLSKSRWLAEVIRSHAATHWPEDVLALGGAWKDFPELDEIRGRTGEDVKREGF